MNHKLLSNISMGVFLLLLNFQFFEYNRVSQIFIAWIITLIPLHYHTFIPQIKSNKKIILYAIIWFVPLSISAFYSDDVGYGFKEVSESLLLILSPFLFFGLPQAKLKRLFTLTKYILPVSTILFFCYIFIRLCIHWRNGYLIQYGDNGLFEFVKFVYNHRFSFLLDGSKIEIVPQFFHKAYFGIFCLFSIVLVQKWKTRNIVKIGIQILLFLLLLLSKGRVQIVLGAFLALYLLYNYTNKNIKLIAAVVVLVITSIAVVLVKKQINPIEKFSENTSVLTRMSVYDAAFEIVSQHPILGIGIGDTQNRLNELYEESNCTICLEKRFNTHNYYLHILLCSGIIGLLIFVIALLKTFNYAQHISIREAVLFLIIIYFSLFFENLYTRMWGCIAYGIFANLTLSLKNRQT